MKVILFLLLTNWLVFAEDPPEGKPVEAAAAPTPDQKASKELSDVEKQVASLAAKIKAKNESIESLLKQKSVERDASKLTEVVKLVQEEHREVKKLTQEYNAQLGILQYRFPERGVMLGRRYQRLNTRSLDEMEKTLGLDTHLKKSRDKVNMVYGIKQKPAVKKKKDGEGKSQTEESLLQPAVISK